MKAVLNVLHRLQMPNQCLMGVNEDLDVAFKDKGAVCGIQSISVIQSLIQIVSEQCRES